MRNIVLIVGAVLLYVISVDHIIRREKKFYQKKNGELIKSETAQKVKGEEYRRIALICIIPLILLIYIYFNHEIILDSFQLNVSIILKYIMVYAALVIGLIMLLRYQYNKYIIKHFVKDYMAEKIEEGYILNLNKGYRAKLIYNKKEPFIKINYITPKTSFYDISVKLLLEIDSEDFMTPEIEKVIEKNQKIGLSIEKIEKGLMIVSRVKLSYRFEPVNKYDLFFNMLDTSIELANKIIYNQS